LLTQLAVYLFFTGGDSKWEHRQSTVRHWYCLPKVQGKKCWWKEPRFV